MSVEIRRATVHEQSNNLDKVIGAISKDSENIAALARIAEMHEGVRKISKVERKLLHMESSDIRI